MAVNLSNEMPNAISRGALIEQPITIRHVIFRHPRQSSALLIVA
jgi:hypothetical protein